MISSWKEHVSRVLYAIVEIVMRVNDPMETDRIRQVKNLLKMKKQIRLKIIILLSDPGSKLSVASREVFKRQEIGDNGTKSLSEPDLQQRGGRSTTNNAAGQ